MNWLDRLVGYVSPVRGMARAVARQHLTAVQARYEAADPSRLRKFYRERGTQNQLVQRDAAAVRAQVRHLARNHDLARGALRVLVNSVIGPSGIGVEPQPRRADGTIHAEYAKALLVAWKDWCRYPEVSQRFSWSRCQRMLARAWFRDGEVFGQHLVGAVPYLDHGTRVPYSLELFESEMVPMDYADGQRIAQGFELNAWGKPVAIYAYRNQPANLMRVPSLADLKRIPYDRVLHMATLDHIGQLRGVSEFASVITRLEDLKDYEESERVAAKIAAMMTAYVKKGAAESYGASAAINGDGAPAPRREISFQPGMIIDDLAPGEDVGLIASDRPNPNAFTWRSGQIRAVSAGIGASYSSISKDYNGTYSAQRQELVEQWVHYAVLADDFAGDVVQPTWEWFVIAAHLSGVVPIPPDVLPDTANDVLMVGQAMPWIDPLKEADAWKALTRSGFASEPEVIRARGKNPDDVLEQTAAWRKKTAAAGLVLESNAATAAAPAAQPEPAAELSGVAQ